MATVGENVWQTMDQVKIAVDATVKRFIQNIQIYSTMHQQLWNSLSLCIFDRPMWENATQDRQMYNNANQDRPIYINATEGGPICVSCFMSNTIVFLEQFQWSDNADVVLRDLTKLE